MNISKKVGTLLFLLISICVQLVLFLFCLSLLLDNFELVGPAIVLSWAWKAAACLALLLTVVLFLVDRSLLRVRPDIPGCVKVTLNRFHTVTIILCLLCIVISLYLDNL